MEENLRELVAIVNRAAIMNDAWPLIIAKESCPQSAEQTLNEWSLFAGTGEIMTRVVQLVVIVGNHRILQKDKVEGGFI